MATEMEVVEASQEVKNTSNEMISGFALQPLSSIPLQTNERNQSTDNTQKVLNRVYECFSNRFPDPKIIQERMREAELQQQKEINAAKSKSLFGRLFGTANNNVKHEKDEILPEDEMQHEVDGQDDQDFVMIDDDDAPLLGTDRFDPRLIPPEAHNCARFHLASTLESNARYAPKSSVKIVNYSGEKLLTNRWAVVGFGEFIEIPNENQNDSNSQLKVETNDIEALIEARENYVNSQTPLVPCINYVRCVQVSTNCIAVSWGMEDGIIVIYRKVQMPNSQKIEWHSVAIVTPLQPVVKEAAESCTLARIVGVSNVNPHQVYESGSLRVTGVEALHLGDAQVGHHTVLAVSRLGGFVEFIIMPSNVCQGPIIAPRKKLRSGQGHYASGLPNISGDQSLPHCWIPTDQVHWDITAMAVTKIDVDENQINDNTSSRDYPPVDYVVCTSGISSSNPEDDNMENNEENMDNALNNESVALWRFSLVDSPNGLQPMVGLLNQISLSPCGPSNTTFASQFTFKNWNGRGMYNVNASTISTPSPISCLTLTSNSKSRYLIATLDHYGGTDIIDCTDVVRHASHEIGFVKKPMYIFRGSQELRRENVVASEGGGAFIAIHWWFSDETLHFLGVTNDGHVIVRTIDTISNAVTNGTTSNFNVVGMTRIPRLSSCSFIQDSQIGGPAKVFGINICEDEDKSISTWSIGHISPQHYLKSLISQGKVHEAFEISKSHDLNFDDSTIMDDCYVEIWEGDKNISAFRSISNSEYVMNEAADITNLYKRHESIDLDTIQELVQEAMNRFIREGINVSEEKVQKVLSNYSRLSTYMATCKNVDKGLPVVSHFLETFYNVDLFTLVKSFAYNGDLTNTLILLIRHWNELGSLSNIRCILDSLPLSTPVSEYECLLPYNSAFDSAEVFLKVYAHVDQNIECFLSQEDSSQIYNAVDQTASKIEEDQDVLLWYIMRAEKMMEGIGFLDNVVTLLNIAIEMTGASSGSDTNEENLLKILSLRASAYHIHCLVELGMHLDANLSDRVQAMTVEEFENLGIPGVIELILGGCENEREIVFRYTEFLSPMLCDDGIGTDFIVRCWPDLHTGEESYNIDRREELELGTVSFCIENLERVLQNDQTSSDEIATVLSMCEAMVIGEHDSATGLITNELLRFQLLMEISSLAVENISLSHTKQLWAIYEALPILESTSCDLFSEMARKINAWYRSFTALTLVLRWKEKAPFSAEFFQKLQDLHGHILDQEKEEDLMNQLTYMGTRMAISIAEGLSKESSIPGEDIDRLFILYISDITDLNEHCFSSLLPVPHILNEVLVPMLLENFSFLLLRKFFICRLIDEKCIISSFEYFVNTIVTKHIRGIKEELSKFIEYFADLSPDCCSIADNSIRYIQFRQFVEESMTISADLVPTMDVLFSAGPFAFLETFMQLDESTILHDCSDWSNEGFSSNQLSILVRHFSSPLQNPPADIGPLPGTTVLHIANMLGLGDPRNQFLVKNLIVHSALYHDHDTVALLHCIIMLHTAIEGSKSGHEIDQEAAQTLLKSVRMTTEKCSNKHNKSIKYLLEQCLSWTKSHNLEEDKALALLSAFDTVEKIVDNGAESATNIDNLQRVLLSKIQALDIDFGSKIECSGTEAIVCTIVDSILPWCIATMIKNPTTEVLEILEVATSILHSRKESVITTKGIQDIINQLEHICTLDNFCPDTVSTDNKIVDHLIFRGYSQNGARRAAFMTNNESAETALLWAVANASNNDFDDPIMVLRSNGVSGSTVPLGQLLLRSLKILKYSLVVLTSNSEDSKSTDEDSMKGASDCSLPESSRCSHNFTSSQETLKESELKERRPETPTIVIPKKRVMNTSEKHKLVEGGRKLLMSQRTTLRRSNRLKLAAEGRKILEQAKGKPSVRSGASVQSTGSSLSSFTWNTMNSRRRQESLFDEESLNEVISTTNDITLNAKTSVHIPQGSNDKIGYEGNRALSSDSNAEKNMKNFQHEKLKSQGRALLKKKREALPKKSTLKVNHTLEDEEDHLHVTRLQPEGEEKARIAAEEEAARLKAEEEERARLISEEEAARLKAEEEERARLAAEEEAARLKVEEEERLRIEEEERARIAAEEEADRIQAEEEAARLAAEREERARLAAEEEAVRLKAEEEEGARIAAEEEAAKTKAEEEERARLAAEEEERVRMVAEEEAARLAAEEEERARIAAEEEAARLKAEAEERDRIAAEEEERARIAAEEEASRLKAEEEERARIAAEEEAARQKAEEEERARIAAEEEAARLAAEEKERARIVAEEEAARLAAEEEEKARIAAEKEAARLKAEEEKRARLAAEEEERARIAAEEEDRARLAAEEEERARIAAEEEAARLKAEEEERARIAAEEAEKARLAAEEEERARIAAEEEAAKLAAEEEEKARIAAEEAEKARLAAEEEERARTAAEEEAARLKAEEEKRARLVAEEEAARLKAEEEEKARIVAEEEAARLAAEEKERARIAAEVEAAKLAAEEAEKARLAAEEEERARIAAEEEAARLKAEEEKRARLVAEEEERARIAAEEEAARLKAEEEERARIAAAEEAARLAAEEEEKASLAAEEEERARISAEECAARLKAEEEERARLKAEEEERARVAAEEEAARLKAEEEDRARLAAEEEAARLKAEDISPSGHEDYSFVHHEENRFFEESEHNPSEVGSDHDLSPCPDPPVEVDDSLSLEGFGEDEDGWGFDNDVSFDQNNSSSNAAVTISNPESCNIVRSVESMNEIDPSTNEDEGWGFDDDDDDGWDFED
ncbi:kinetoplast-associated protein-like protein [Chaetoceros tenuissimus]|uniref:Kinetoplast-associated protein-like protein n=1 Tax=Chaetoceros tenuissimus TaxID=426638 RepID=A0AAD3D6M7_9STRA|nr:kinetoplast-associated protein-like protein [Chaetoceros tenuissimus]